MMKSKEIRIEDKDFELFIDSESIKQAIDLMAERINADFTNKEPVLIIGVLTGAFVFASDLIRSIDLPRSQISFTRLSSYEGTCTTGKVREILGLCPEAVEGKHVIVLEDIIETGLTLRFLYDRLKEYGAASITIATLLFKPDTYLQELPVQYKGFVIPNDFVVGYGLDYKGFGRNFDSVYKLVIHSS